LPHISKQGTTASALLRWVAGVVTRLLGQWEATAAEAATLAEQLRTVQSQLEAAHTERARLQELVEAPTEQGAWEVQARLDATLLQLSQLQVRASLM